MSNASVGTGQPGESNENPAPDSQPSKTMGAESGPDQQASSAQGSQGAGTEADVLAPDELLRDVPSKGVPVNPDDYPDGPNVAPSPWEEDAARGKA